MVRMGPENERKLKASLRALRQQIATGEVAKKKS
jgi:ribosomal protein L29